jgi:phosphate-selective porin OprO/OprP
LEPVSKADSRLVRVIFAFAVAIVPPVGAAAQQAADTTLAPPAEPASSAGAATNEQRENEPDRWTFRWEEHPTLHFGDDTRIEFRARVRADLRESEAPTGSADAFDLARRRIGVEGLVRGVVGFQIEREINDDEPWRDVFVNYRQFPSVQVQAGKFKLPFGLEENTSSTNLDFVYRSRQATQLAPGRDRGLMVHGRLLDRVLGYEAGVFEHDGDNARSRNPERVFGGTTIAARVTAQPLRSRKSLFRDLQVGAAVTSSRLPEGMAALRGRTALDASFFPADVWVQGMRRRLGLELRWRQGPSSVRAEYTRVSTERREQSVSDTDLSDLIASGWYVSGTYLVTGERKSAGADAPRRPLFRGGYGAIELAGRLEELSFRSAGRGEDASLSPRADVVLGNADRITTVGVNWHPFRGVKLQANLVGETIADPERGPLPGKRRFWSRLLMLQLTI